MDKEEVSPRRFDAAIRGLLAVPKEAIQQTMEKALSEKRKRTKQRAIKKKG